MNLKLNRRQLLRIIPAAALATSLPGQTWARSADRNPLYGTTLSDSIGRFPYEAPDAGAYARFAGLDHAETAARHLAEHASLVAGLNATLARLGPAYQSSPLARLCGTPLDGVDGEDLRYYASGHLNHSLALRWGTAPTDEIADLRLLGLIAKGFGSVAATRLALRSAARRLRGSGWVWLTVDGTRARVVTTTANDTPLARNMRVLFGIDLWEHAYLGAAEREAYVHLASEHIDWAAVADTLESYERDR